MDFIVVYVTAPQEELASKIAKTLVEQRLAACVNIVRNIRSIYHWEGKIEDDQEVLMIIKTTKGCIEDLIRVVKAHHSYTVPEIIALPIIEGSKDYLDWLRDTVKA
jgi:periplasmic divalent cation tolerance protein